MSRLRRMKTASNKVAPRREKIRRVLSTNRSVCTRLVPHLQIERLEDRSLLAADFGDAPFPYPTTLAENGAQHAPSGPTLGINRDTENSGSHTATANGDDHIFNANGIAEGNEEADDGNSNDGDGVDSSGHLDGSTALGNIVDDEDGVTFGLLNVGPGGGVVTVNVANAPAGAKLDAWIDFNGDGSWNETDDQIADNLPVVEGNNDITFDVPSVGLAGKTFARFRLSTAGNLDPVGVATDGEVEDHAVTFFRLDLGDAPQPFPVTLAEDGARHFIPDLNHDSLDNDGDAQTDEGDEFGPALGGNRDDEVNGTHSDFASFDDGDADNDDEDGVVFEDVRAGLSSSVNVEISGFDPNEQGPKLDAWIDFNGDGDWNDPLEQIADNLTLDVSGFQSNHTVEFNVPADALTGIVIARFRLSTDGNLDPTGSAADGEVEDHLVNILPAIALGTEGNDKIRIRPTAGPNGPVNVNLVVRGREVLLHTFPINEQIIVMGLGGNDTITVIGALNRPVTVLGGTGNDKITGGDGDDTLEGQEGKDTLKGGAGEDLLLGGADDDKLEGGEGDDRLLGHSGRNSLKGNNGNDTLIGDGQDDKLDGGLGDDLLFGGSGNDSLKGNDGNDILLGESGNDTLSAKRGFDLLIGGEGLDKLTGGSKGNSILIGGGVFFDDSFNNLDEALLSILEEWSRLDGGESTPLLERINHLTNPNSGGANGAAVLIFGENVEDDGVVDRLKYSFGFNWIFPGQGDVLSRAKATDLVES